MNEVVALTDVKEANSDHKNISLHHTKLKEYKGY
jgi:hypothetical protein